MAWYDAVDDRAKETLHQIVKPCRDAVLTANTLPELGKVIKQYLPSMIAYNVELQLRIDRMNDHHTGLHVLAFMTIDSILGREICQGLPVEIDENGTRWVYYTREDIIRWYQERTRKDYFVAPITEEIIDVQLLYGDHQLKMKRLTLTQDQVVGIAYGLDVLETKYGHHVQWFSSITGRALNEHSIVNHTLIYRLPRDDATDKLKRPYTVEVLKSDDTFQTLHFVHPEFMQGLVSAAMWFNLPDRGKGVLWRNLTQFTREGVVALDF
jgi:hypothetical protein